MPSLKLTQRPAYGEKTVEFIKRGVSQPLTDHHLQENTRESFEDFDSDTSHHPDLDMPATFFTPSDLVEPTSHELESRASVAGWESVRSVILNAVTEAAAMPLGQICLHCEATASIRCKQCGPFGYYCLECFLGCHNTVNLFHIAEKWEVQYKYSLISVPFESQSFLKVI